MSMLLSLSFSWFRNRGVIHGLRSSVSGAAGVTALCLGMYPGGTLSAAAPDEPLPIADVHVHYSHDSVDMTPPERVIELMRSAQLKFALVSSSDDTGTQLLSQLAPDLIVPGLRPYRRRGELSTWFKDPDALAYVESLLQKNRYATIGEFHLYGDDALLPIPQRLVELAEQYNLILHAHSDAEAVENLLASSDTVKVIWAHSGFEGPEAVAEMLAKHERLWADLAFRSEVGGGGVLSKDWIDLFTRFPDRMMLGTDTYTPERMYFIPSHADEARTWLSSLPGDVAERIAWRNGYELVMPHWLKNNQGTNAGLSRPDADQVDCETPDSTRYLALQPVGEDAVDLSAYLALEHAVSVGEAFSVSVLVCSDLSAVSVAKVDAVMPAHGHGMNYTPEVSTSGVEDGAIVYRADGMLFHMPGEWQWQVDITVGNRLHRFAADYNL